MKSRHERSELRVIRASELGEYNYCSRAWWYKHVAKLAPSGEVSERFERGNEAHKQHGKTILLSARLRIMGAALLLLGLLALILAIAVK